MFGKILEKINGWKRVIGYLILQVPFFNNNPALLEATQKLIESPSAQTALPALGHLFLVIGTAHAVIKAINGEK